MARAIYIGALFIFVAGSVFFGGRVFSRNLRANVTVKRWGLIQNLIMFCNKSVLGITAEVAATD